MPDGDRDLVEGATVRLATSIHDIKAEDWDRCAGQHRTDFNPFVRHAFMAALEDSESANQSAGFLPQHAVMEAEDGRVLACAPMYLKSHSYGEYVFDWGWADAYERAGGRYYPKLQCAVPFTPVTGPRLMVRDDLPDTDQQTVRRGLAAAMQTAGEKLGIATVHVTFPDEAEWNDMGELGYLQRIGQQYHWKNDHYEDFGGFLDSLSSRKRKNIRKEREKANDFGIDIFTLQGDEITSRHWDAFHHFYRATSDRKWGQAYLTREFFDLLSQTMGDQVVLIMGEEDGELVCGALNLLGGDALYGRNWGTILPAPMLHFEVCYYRAIDYAIQHNLTWVEAGAQGPHKLQRGYLPRRTYSNHYIVDPAFQDAVARFLKEERHAIENDIEIGQELGPFKKSG